MMGKIKEMQQRPESPPEPAPEITPEMVQTAFKALESKGMVYYSEGRAYIPTEMGWKLLMNVKELKEEIIAYGHPNITATHTKTFEITKSTSLNKEGDCIIAVGANKACKDFSQDFKNELKKAKKIEIIIEANGVKDKVIAYGSPALKLTNKEDIVIRKSDFIDNRTLAILADKSANELNQELIEKLRNEKTKVRIVFEIS